MAQLAASPILPGIIPNALGTDIWDFRAAFPRGNPGGIRIPIMKGEQLPGLPTLPPVLPTLPGDLTLPGGITLPTLLPTLLPGLPTLPSLPDLTLPAGITLPNIQLPNISLPDLGDISLPGFPQLSDIVPPLGSVAAFATLLVNLGLPADLAGSLSQALGQQQASKLAVLGSLQQAAQTLADETAVLTPAGTIGQLLGGVIPLMRTLTALLGPILGPVAANSLTAAQFQLQYKATLQALPIVLVSEIVSGALSSLILIHQALQLFPVSGASPLTLGGMQELTAKEMLHQEYSTTPFPFTQSDVNPM